MTAVTDSATLTCAPQTKALPSTLGASVSVYCSSVSDLHCADFDCFHQHQVSFAERSLDFA
jgi:hypothetical protein